MSKLPCTEGEAYGQGELDAPPVEIQVQATEPHGLRGGFFVNEESHLGEAKRAARGEATAARRRLSDSERAEAARAIARRLESLPEFASAQTVALYASMGTEVDTWEIARRALELRKQVVWPRIAPGTRTLELAPCAPDAFVPGPLGIRQPAQGVEPVPLQAVDCILIPGVAFDEGCHRLGRGGGHYDATLAALLPRTARIALAYESQIIPAVPVGPHDLPVDMIVTERRVLTRPLSQAPMRAP
jgi:5-formyltetrahydrofolate cyclo-ligase